MFHSFFKGSGIRCPVACFHAMNEYVLVWTDSTTKRAFRLFSPHHISHIRLPHTSAPDVTLLLYNQPTESARRMNHIAHLRQQCHNSKFVIFSGETLKGFEVL
jgi:hypothetical protein